MPRMWLVAPALMCRKHMIAEHHELHVFIGKLRKGTSLTGYFNNNLVEIPSLWARHEQLASYMVASGYNHNSPFPDVEEIETLATYLPAAERTKTVDKVAAWQELVGRCPDCAAKIHGQRPADILQNNR